MPDFTEEERRILKLWYLSCEDMELEHNGCGKCPFKVRCATARHKLRLWEIE